MLYFDECMKNSWDHTASVSRRCSLAVIMAHVMMAHVIIRPVSSPHLLTYTGSFVPPREILRDSPRMSAQVSKRPASWIGSVDVVQGGAKFQPSLASLLTLAAPTTPPPERKMRIVNVSHRENLPTSSSTNEPNARETNIMYDIKLLFSCSSMEGREGFAFKLQLALDMTV